MVTRLPLATGTRWRLPEFTLFRWVSGLYLLILGVSLLILPQGNLGVRLSPIWLYGSFIVGSGLTMLWLSVLSPSRRWEIGLSLIAAFPLVVCAWAYLQLAVLPAMTVFFVLAVGIVWSALTSPIRAQGYQPDALGLVFGIIQIVQGFDLLWGPSAAVAVPAQSGLTSGLFGALFVVGGLGVIVSQLVASTPGWLRKGLHVLAGGSLLVLWVLQSLYIDSLYWILSAAVVLRGGTTLLLPWCGARMRQIDRTALRPRLALGLITAALLPALIAIVIFLNVFDEALVGRHVSRPVLFGIVLSAAGVSGVIAWWLAGKLTAPLTALVRAVQRIPQGHYDFKLPQSGVHELLNLEAAIGYMSKTIAAQVAERERLIDQLQEQNMSLQKLEKSFRMVAENATDIITRFDRDLRHVYVNPAVQPATGLPPEHFLGKTNRELSMMDDLVANWDSGLKAVFTTGVPATLEFSYQSPGGPRFYQSQLAPETDETGAVISVLAIAHDVTSLRAAQQHTERALRAMLTITAATTLKQQSIEAEAFGWQRLAQELLDSICAALQCAGAVMVIFAPNSQIIDELVVSEFEHDKQRLLEQVRGKALRDRFEDASIVTRLEQGETVHLDVREPFYADRQPDAVLQQAVLVPMRVGQTLIGMLTLYARADLPFNKDEWTAIATAAGQLAGLLLERERLFSEREEARAAALAAEETARYAEELQRTNDDLRLFSHIVSHDLNEPLRMITSYLELLKKRYGAKLDSDAGEFLDFASDGAARMKVLLAGLLSYTRLGAQGSAMTPVDMAQILQFVLRNLSVRIEEANAAITYDPLPTVTADEQQIGQVLQNLIGNALKFRKTDGECSIHVAAHREPAGWRFMVRDNGVGIDQKYWERIFLIFQRVGESRQVDGTGIGLAICKKIIERHHGSIWLESEVGAGSTFFFTIPDSLH